MNFIKLNLLVIVAITMFTGCVGTKVLTPEEQEAVRLFDVSKISELGLELKKGIDEDELLFYAPLSIEKVKELYADAMEEEDKIKKMSAYNSAKEILANAYKNKSLVKQHLVEVADIDKSMKEQNTNTVFASRYNDFYEDYMDLIVMIDKGKTTEVLEDKIEVMTDANELYGDTVVFNNIENVKRLLKKMQDDGFDALAPVNYEKATKLYESTRLSIKGDAFNVELVKKLSQEAIEAAVFAQTLARDVSILSKLNEEDYENYFVRLHTSLSSLNPDEIDNTILPYPINEKISHLKALLEKAKSTVEKDADTSKEASAPEVEEEVITPEVPKEEVKAPEIEEEVITPEVPKEDVKASEVVTDIDADTNPSAQVKQN